MIDEIIFKLDGWFAPIISSLSILLIIKISIWIYNYRKDKRLEEKIDTILEAVKTK